MKNKKIFLCYSNGILKQKNETKITYDDIHECDYFMIPINTINNCYTLIKPSKHLMFTHGIIHYQLCTIDDNGDEVTYIPNIYIETQVDSICDLIGLINSIDKITIANYITTEDYICDWNFSIGVLSIDIRLFDNDNVIYEEKYVTKGISSSSYDPYKITKRFKSIYDSSICGELFMDDVYMIIEQKKHCLKWYMINGIHKCYDTTGYVGIPLMSSNTLVFCIPSHLEKLVVYNRLDLFTFVYCEKNDFIGEISESIVNGDDYDEIENKIRSVDDIYFDTHKIISSHYKKPWTRLLEVIAHSFFCINLIYTVFNNLYEHNLPFNEDSTNEYDFDIIITLRACNRNDKFKKYKEISINKYSLLSLNDIMPRL